MGTRVLRSIIGAAALFAVASSCSETRAPTAPSGASAQPSLIGSLLGTPLQLLSCTVTTTSIGAKVIGPAGGTVVVGPHRLTVPPGALASPTLIQGVSLPGPISEVTFLPEGLQFQKPATLTLSYAACSTPKSTPLVVYINILNSILETEPSKADATTKTVTASIRHFSAYAIAY
jgi:hypothetical protein